MMGLIEKQYIQITYIDNLVVFCSDIYKATSTASTQLSTVKSTKQIVSKQLNNINQESSVSIMQFIIEVSDVIIQPSSV